MKGLVLSNMMDTRQSAVRAHITHTHMLSIVHVRRAVISQKDFIVLRCPLANHSFFLAGYV